MKAETRDTYHRAKDYEAFVFMKVRQFWDREDGQDLVEWVLLIAFIVLGSAALTYNGKDSVARIWTATNTALTIPAGSSSGDR